MVDLPCIFSGSIITLGQAPVQMTRLVIFRQPQALPRILADPRSGQILSVDMLHVVSILEKLANAWHKKKLHLSYEPVG